MRRVSVLLAALTACHVPLFALEGRRDFADGRYDQAVTHYDAALAHEVREPGSRTDAWVRQLRAEALAAWVRDEVAAASALAGRGDLAGAHARLSSAMVTSSDPTVSAEVRDEVVTALEGVVRKAAAPHLAALAQDRRAGAEWFALERLVEPLPPGNPARVEILAAIAAYGERYHHAMALGHRDRRGVAWLHACAAVRAGAPVDPQDPSAALTRETQPSWRVERTGVPCPALDAALARAFPTGTGVEAVARVHVDRCEPTFREWTAVEPYVWEERVSYSETVQTGTTTSCSVSSSGTVSTLTEYYAGQTDSMTATRTTTSCSEVPVYSEVERTRLEPRTDTAPTTHREVGFAVRGSVTAASGDWTGQVAFEAHPTDDDVAFQGRYRSQSFRNPGHGAVTARAGDEALPRLAEADAALRAFRRDGLRRAAERASDPVEAEDAVIRAALWDGSPQASSAAPWLAAHGWDGMAEDVLACAPPPVLDNRAPPLVRPPVDPSVAARSAWVAPSPPPSGFWGADMRHASRIDVSYTWEQRTEQPEGDLGRFAFTLPIVDRDAPATEPILWSQFELETVGLPALPRAQGFGLGMGMHAPRWGPLAVEGGFGFRWHGPPEGIRFAEFVMHADGYWSPVPAFSVDAGVALEAPITKVSLEEVRVRFPIRAGLSVYPTRRLWLSGWGMWLGRPYLGARVGVRL